MTPCQRLEQPHRFETPSPSFNEERLDTLIRIGDLAAVKQAIEANTNLDLDWREQSSGSSFLDAAFSSNTSNEEKIELVRYLVSKMKNLDEAGLFGDPAVTAVFDHSIPHDIKPTLLKILLDHGASPNTVNSINCTPIWNLAHENLPLKTTQECLRLLIDAGATHHMPDRRSIIYCPLHLAIQHKHTHFVEAFLKLLTNPIENSENTVREITPFYVHNRARGSLSKKTLAAYKKVISSSDFIKRAPCLQRDKLEATLDLAVNQLESEHYLLLEKAVRLLYPDSISQTDED